MATSDTRWDRADAILDEALDLPAALDLEPPSAATVDSWIDAFARLGVRLINRRSIPSPKPEDSSHVGLC